MSAKNKICLIIHSLSIGGMERVMALLAANFAGRENAEVHLLLIGRGKKIVYDIPNSVIIHRPAFTFNNKRRTVDTLRTIYFVRSQVKKIHPDSILSFGEYWNNLVLLSLFGLPYPVYISDRSKPNKNLGRFQNFLRNSLYPGAAGYIAQTEEAQKVCLSKGWNDKIRVIGNPIRKIESKNKVDKENIVLTVGRLIKTKHIDQLIRMFVEINPPDWKLLIVGGDAKKLNLSNKLNSLIDQLGAQNSVFLEGEQKDIEWYYRKSKIFAFTSSSEGFPNVIGEAMSAGLPVIAFDCVAGPSELISDGGNGFLIPLFETGKYADKLEVLMKDNELREEMGQRSLQKIQDFSLDRIGEKYYNFISAQA